MNLSIAHLGPLAAPYCFYLPNPPQLPEKYNHRLMTSNHAVKKDAVTHSEMINAEMINAESTSGAVKRDAVKSYEIKSGELNIDEIIALNGNHWRKILVIMAKICSPNDNWRSYLPRLLTQNELIRFNATQLHPGATHHFVCGQRSAQNLGLTPLTTPQSFEHQTEGNRHIYRLPYLDYRQCPNSLIDELKKQI
ncbi:hypothetical protein LZP69_09840 [Shewanella sp. AS1]|uniref:DUF6942 family protein n=1 Tax=Shewanella sp. AS1 TaxID=2907626 RepID=UPI001F20A7E5|nr:hypothetical protein [Shewanella sp. AS1]MCE9679462.1 hypothetical protein [Shewanella sp. AS1]